MRTVLDITQIDFPSIPHWSLDVNQQDYLVFSLITSQSYSEGSEQLQFL